MTAPSDNIIELLNAVVDGHATSQQRTALYQRMRQEPKLVRLYADYTAVHAELLWQHREASINQPENTRATTTPGRLKLHPVGWAVAAALLLAAAIWFGIRSDFTSHDQTDRPAPHVGFVTNTVNAQFAPSSSPVTLGGELTHEPIRLLSGQVQIMFHSGAVADLTGPCIFEMVGANRGKLSAGKLQAYVPASGKGFTVDLPGDRRVVDLGTAFGVMVSADGSAMVDVFEGRVRIEGAGEPRVLEAEQVVVLSDDTLRSIDPGQSVFADHHAYQRWKRWSEQAQRDAALLYYEPFVPGEVAGQMIGSPTWGEGRFTDKPALTLDGQNQAVAVNIPGRFEQLTLAMWVNVQSLDRPINDLFAADGATASVQLHLMRDGRFGYAGVGADLGRRVKLIGPDEIRRWIHVAVTFDLPTRRIHVYRGGELVHTEPIDATRNLFHIGSARIGNWDPTNYNHQGGTLKRGLHARFDELLILSRAATADEIRRIYTAGAPETSQAPASTAPSISLHQNLHQK